MGCTASRPQLEDDHHPHQLSPSNDWYSKGAISVPAPHTQSPSLHDFNIVPLSSSSYGINMKLAKLQEGQELSGYGDDHQQKEVESMKQMLQVLESLDMGTSDPSEQPKRKGDGPVSSILEDLKPGLEKHFSQALGKPLKGELINGKENAKPDPLSGSNSPTRRHKAGSASPGPKPSKSSKPSFASRFLKKSFGSVGSQKGDDAGGDKSASVQEATTPPNSKGDGGQEAGRSLFDADFLASYESALKELSHDDWNTLKDDADQQKLQAANEIAQTQTTAGDMALQPKPAQIPTQVSKKREDPLEKYEKLCPPGGEKTVVLYTTSLRGIRKTFEDCNSLRDVLESFQVSVDERDVAMHQGYRNELREMMGNNPVPVPRLFIKGRYIGGAEEVLQLHEEQELAPLLQGLPQDHRNSTHPCDGCGGARFVPCLDCSGSRKVVDPQNPREVIRCWDCNENGLIQCPICS